MCQVRFTPRRRERAGHPQRPGGKKRTLSCGAVEQKKDSPCGQTETGQLPPLPNKVQVHAPLHLSRFSSALGVGRSIPNNVMIHYDVITYVMMM